MEKEAAHGRPQPRTADERSRLVVTALLLIGGAFVLSLIWFVRYERIFMDRVTSYVPQSAEMVLTLPLGEGSSSVLGRFGGDFGAALASIRFDEHATLVMFVERGVDNEPEWHLMTDAVVDLAALPPQLFSASFGRLRLISSSPPRLHISTKRQAGRLRVLRRGQVAGFISENLVVPFAPKELGAEPARLPLRLIPIDEGIKLEVGKRFRGFIKQHEAPVDARQITFLPENLAAYVIIPPGRLPPPLATYRLETTLWESIQALGMTAEIVLTNEGHYATLLHDKNGAPKIEVLEASVIEELRTLEPKEVASQLPDGTRMTELRLNRGKVELKERSLPQDILLRKYSSEDGRVISLVLYPDGRLWITNDTNLVSSLLISDVSWEVSELACQPNSSRPGIIFTDRLIEDIPNIGSDILALFSKFKVNFMRIEDGETGLFTFCGYF